MEEDDFGSPWAASFRSRYEEFDEPIEPGYGIAYRDKDGKDLNGIPWINGIYSTMEELNEGIQNLKDCDCTDITPYKIDGEHPETVTWDYVNQNRF